MTVTALNDYNASMAPSWTSLFQNYKTWARVVDVIDGDSIIMIFPSFHEIKRPIKFNTRLADLDTAEIRDKNHNVRTQAVRARLRLIELLLQTDNFPSFSSRADIQKYFETHPTQVWVCCRDLDKYGRVLVEVFTNESEIESVCINKRILAEGLAQPYDGGKKPVF